MKRISVSVAVCVWLVFLASCASNMEETVATTENSTEPSYIASSTYQEFGEAISALIHKYDTYETQSGAFSLCRLIVSCDKPIDFGGLGAVEILKDPNGIYVLQFESATETENAYKELFDRDGVNYVESDVLINVDVDEGTATGENTSWGKESVGADVFAAVLKLTDYAKVTVAVVDSGVSNHEMLNSRLIKGVDFIDDDEDPVDMYGHGTHVAGIIVDSTPELSIDILPVRVLNENGKGPSSIVATGIKYAVENGADIINLSLSGGHTKYIDDAIENAIASGTIVVASAGNKAVDIKNACPAHIEDCITVSAIDGTYQIASFSNYGEAVDFAAPGVSIYSAVPEGYAYKDGTSMAAPYISALAAMLRASGIATTVNEVQNMLISCSLDLGEVGRDNKYGHGLPQINTLVNLLDVPVYFKTGVYYRTDEEGTLDRLVISAVNDNSVVFSADWHRLASISRATAEILGNTATFYWEDQLGGCPTHGNLEVTDDGTVVLTLTETEFSEISTGRYEYAYLGTEEEAAIADNQAILLMNDSIRCWVGAIDKDSPQGATVVYIRFFADGTFTCWRLVPNYGDAIIEKTQGTYVVEASMIYIDGCAYDLYAYTAGSTQMSLTAKGFYEIDLSGDYYCQEDEVYQQIIDLNI